MWLAGPGGSPHHEPATPGATTSTPRAAQHTYAFVRDTNTWGPNSVPYGLARQWGADTVLFASTDPNLTAAVAAARAAGEWYGIWVPAGEGSPDPIAYARYVVRLGRRYEPQILVLDIEARGKGNLGSAGWAFNRLAAREVSRAVPGAHVGVAMLPDEADFNYRAWLENGAAVFLPEAFGPDPRTNRFDPAAVVQTVVESGVPPAMVEPVLAPGQRYDRPSSLYALDDIPTTAEPTSTPMSP